MDPAVEPRWEHFPHGADIGIRGIGPTLESALAQVALALTAVTCEPGRVEHREKIEIACDARSGPDELLYDWLDAVIFEMATRNMLFGAFDVRIDDGRVLATLHGEPVDRVRHEPAVEVKGPTYTELRVSRDKQGREWVAQCVVDV